MALTISEFSKPRYLRRIYSSITSKAANPKPHYLLPFNLKVISNLLLSETPDLGRQARSPP